MLLSTWLLYVAAVFVLTVTPGPSVLMCVSTAVNLGPRKALITSLGSTSAIVGLMTLSALGLGALLAASETLFTALKWAGAAYLAYLGVRALLAPASDIQVAGGAVAGGRRLFAQGFLVGLSNPKALLFFGALFPQFLNPAAPQLPQFLVLGATFVFFELGWLTVYALSAARAQRWLQQPQRARQFNRLTGAVFLLAAGLLATSKRQPA
ncbi:MAG: LysE family translocator [Hydrogenophaga sp.]|uniref:LysE family translocator n=1 Tax=Hydrogenophaga sp. TaxID=1904254 RepID=UPI003D9ADC4F